MLMSDAVKLAVLAVIFGCGAALLSYRFYAAYRRWSFGEFSGKAHLPGILGTALMLFAMLFASSLGWMHLVVVVLGGAAVSYLYVYVFRMWTEVALFGPVFVALAIFLVPMRYWDWLTPTAPQPSRRDRHRAVRSLTAGSRALRRVAECLRNNRRCTFFSDLPSF